MIELDVFPNRPLTALVVRTTGGTAQRPSPRRGPYAPPQCHLDGPPRVDLQSQEIAHLCHRLLASLLIGCDDVGGLADELAPGVVLWTPSLYASSSIGVFRAIVATDPDSHPVSETTFDVTSTDVVPPRVVLAWRVEGRFTTSCFVDDDLLIEPTGQLVETAGTFIITFGPDGITAMHLYYDAFAMMEQLLSVP